MPTAIERETSAAARFTTVDTRQDVDRDATRYMLPERKDTSER